MATSRLSAVEMYLPAHDPAQGARYEYQTTVRKWLAEGGKVPLEKLDRPTLRRLLFSVYERVQVDGGTNPRKYPERGADTPADSGLLGPGE